MVHETTNVLPALVAKPPQIPQAQAGADDDDPVSDAETPEESRRAFELKTAFYRWHVFMVAVPLGFAVFTTLLRGVGPMCMFDNDDIVGTMEADKYHHFTAEELDDSPHLLTRRLGLPSNFGYAAFHEYAVVLAPAFIMQWFWLHAPALLPIHGVRGSTGTDSTSTGRAPRIWGLAVCSGTGLHAGVWEGAAGGVGAFFCLYIPLQWSRDPEEAVSWRVAVLVPIGFLMSIGIIVGAHLFSRFCSRRYGGEKLYGQPFARAMRAMAMLQAGSTFASTASLVFAMTVIPRLIDGLVSLPLLLRVCAEMTIAGFFFSIWLPVVEKLFGRMLLPHFMLPRKEHFAEPGRDKALIATELERRRRAVIFHLNYNFDVLRFIYGRGILLRLHPVTVVLVIMRDCIYHVWHFALRQEESLLLFTVKLSHPKWRQSIPISWQRISKTIYHMQRFTGVARYFRVAHEEKYDFRQGRRVAEAALLTERRERDPFELRDLAVSSEAGSSTAGSSPPNYESMKLHFCNMQVTLSMVDERVADALFRQNSEFTSGNNVQVVKSSRQSEMKSRGIQESSSPSGRDLSVSESLGLNRFGSIISNANDDTLKTAQEIAQQQAAAEGQKVGVSGALGRLWRSSFAHLRASGVRASGVLPAATGGGAGTSAPSRPSAAVLQRRSKRSSVFNSAMHAQMWSALPSQKVQLPVTTAEAKAFRGFVRFYRRQNFLRYQIRANIRILVSLTMILIPLLSSATNVYYFPGFPQHIWPQALIVPLIFLAEDLTEWWVITHRFTLFDNTQIRDIVPALLGFFDETLTEKSSTASGAAGESIPPAPGGEADGVARADSGGELEDCSRGLAVARKTKTTTLHAVFGSVLSENPLARAPPGSGAAAVDDRVYRVWDVRLQSAVYDSVEPVFACHRPRYDRPGELNLESHLPDLWFLMVTTFIIDDMDAKIVEDERMCDHVPPGK
eukprot:CAMPEP_0178993270 /NCGR_PEP_ID=MMETSP0795-20121207/6611_1 /TAXON_ID=88552 /ORGANISM="Amoebophrya sp., Strain Ameob2" /LENGTH=955 /DNA_ID=CAMNT_0020685313 /DNA_START=101 /DNA_END=2966 /DNA_ORIENTATION=+